MDYNAYMVHNGFNNIENSNTLEMIPRLEQAFSDSRQNRLYFEGLARNDVIKGQKQCSTLTDLRHPTHWWDYIESDFMSIFGPIVSGIRVFHCHGKYHDKVMTSKIS